MATLWRLIGDVMRPMETETFAIPKLGYSLAETEVAIGVSRATLYRMLARGELKAAKVGRRRIVPDTELRRLCCPQEHVA